MRIDWRFGSADVMRVRRFVDARLGDPFVRRRCERNLASDRSVPKRPEFWKAHIACLLTTQQRSGPNSPVSRFLREVPFPLSWKKCSEEKRLESFIRRTISEGRGLRRTRTISEEAAANFALMNSPWWDETRALLKGVLAASTPEAEREAARHIQASMHGFGPKQSRNLLQTLGLSRYEIPVDSRVVKWLNELRFPVPLSAAALGDENYYSFVLDGVQRLCEACSIYPCVLDAVVFSSFDKEGWPEGGSVF